MYKNKKTPKLILFFVFFLLISGCSTPLPTATPTPLPSPLPTATATHQARPTATTLATATTTATPTPAPTIAFTPTPEAGYYRHPELGFWFLYPTDWNREETGSNLPAVIISDNDDPLRLLAGGRTVEEDLELSDFARNIGQDMGFGQDIDIIDDGPITLADGIPAWEVTFNWNDEDDKLMQGQGYAVLSGGKGYALLMIGRPEVLSTRPKTIQAIGQSLHLEAPEIFGISRTNALVLLSDDPGTLDPIFTTEAANGIIGHIFSGLVQFNADLQLEPNLAERWEISDDGTIYTFHLHPGATFHSGSPLTANDVKQAWERATDPSLASPTAPLYLGDILGAKQKLAGEADSLSGITVVDDYTLRVTLDGPKPYFLGKLTHPVSFITHSNNVNDGPNWWQQPDGSGPFSLKRWQKESVLILERNETYHTPTNIAALIYYLYGGSGFLAYEAGQLDIATVGSYNLSRAQDPVEPLSADLTQDSPFCTTFITFNTTQAPFDDVAVRQAFSLAINREQLAQVVLNSSSTPATTFLPPGMPGHKPRPVSESFTERFDVEAAEALLAESDYGTADALPILTFTIPGTDEPDPLAVALVDMWTTNLGVTIETDLIDNTEYNNAITTNPSHLFITPWCATYPDPENLLDLHYHSLSHINYGGYTAPDLDDLLEKARTESDPLQRLALYQQAEDHLLSNLPALPIIHPLTHILVRPYIKNYQPYRLPVLWVRFVNIER